MARLLFDQFERYAMLKTDTVYGNGLRLRFETLKLKRELGKYFTRFVYLPIIRLTNRFVKPTNTRSIAETYNDTRNQASLLSKVAMDLGSDFPDKEWARLQNSIAAHNAALREFDREISGNNQ